MRDASLPAEPSGLTGEDTMDTRASVMEPPAPPAPEVQTPAPMVLSAPSSPALAAAGPMGMTASAAASVSALTTSADVDQLIAGIASAQVAFGRLLADERADVASKKEGARSYSYTYASLGAVLNIVRPKLAENGCALLQLPFTRMGSVTVTTLIAHVSGQWLRNDLNLPCPVQNLDPQGISSAITYAKRIALKALLGVSEEGDDDDALRAGGGSSFQRPAPPPVTMPQRQSAAPTNGHGHGSAPAPVPTPTAPAPAPAVFITKVEARKKTNGDPFWAVSFSAPIHGHQSALTFHRSVGDKLQEWDRLQKPIADATFSTKPKPGGGEWVYLDEIVAGGAQ